MTRFHALQISSVNTGADEPLWVVNIKKSIASQLQLDVTGVRGDASAKDGESSTFSVYEVQSKRNQLILQITSYFINSIQ